MSALLVIPLLVANGFFVAAEFALIAARRTQMDLLASGGSRSARTVVKALDNVTTMVAGAQLGVTVASLLLGAIGEPAIADLVRPAFDHLGANDDVVHPVAFAIALTLIVSAHVMLGEMVPKNLALAGPDRAAVLLVPPLYWFSYALRPVLFAIRVIADGALTLLRIPAGHEARTVYTADELPALIRESRSHHLLDQHEHDLMIETLALQARPVSEVTLALDEMVTVGPDTTAAQLQERAARHTYSRFPVSGARPGELLGYLHILDALRGAPDDHLPVRPLVRIPDTATLSEVLATMRGRRAQLAAVCDPRGAVCGVATLDDVLAALLSGPRPPVAPSAAEEEIEG